MKASEIKMAFLDSDECKNRQASVVKMDWLLDEGVKRLESDQSVSFKEWAELLSAADRLFSVHRGESAGRLLAAVLQKGVDQLTNGCREDGINLAANIARYIGDQSSAYFRCYCAKEVDDIMLSLIVNIKTLNGLPDSRENLIHQAVFAWLSCGRPSHKAVDILTEHLMPQNPAQK